MSDPDKNSFEKGLAVLDALMGHPVSGLSNASLASGLNMSTAAVTRATQSLIKFGWARKDPSSNLFHPTARVSALAFKVLADFDAAETALQDQRASFTRRT